MEYSKELSQAYDTLMGDYTSLILLTKQLVEDYSPKKNFIKLLEVGCGTGNMLAAMPKSYLLYGLDISNEMLKIAKKKVVQAIFYHKDMRNFRLHETFDIITSPFEPFNHLLSYNQWKQAFKSISIHLVSHGVFIFDINTQKRHERLSKLPAYVYKKKSTLYTIRILSEGKNRYATRIQIFKNLKSKKINLTEENIYEVSFPIDKIKMALDPYFSITKTLDPYRKHVTKYSGRVVFVCRKK